MLREHADDDVNGIVLEANFYFLGRSSATAGRRSARSWCFAAGTAGSRTGGWTSTPWSTAAACSRRASGSTTTTSRDLNAWIKKMNWYATREMQDYFSAMQSDPTGGALSEKRQAATRKKKYGPVLPAADVPALLDALRVQLRLPAGLSGRPRGLHLPLDVPALVPHAGRCEDLRTDEVPEGPSPPPARSAKPTSMPQGARPGSGEEGLHGRRSARISPLSSHARENRRRHGTAQIHKRTSFGRKARLSSGSRRPPTEDGQIIVL